MVARQWPERLIEDPECRDDLRRAASAELTPARLTKVRMAVMNASGAASLRPAGATTGGLATVASKSLVLLGVLGAVTVATVLALNSESPGPARTTPAHLELHQLNVKPPNPSIVPEERDPASMTRSPVRASTPRAAPRPSPPAQPRAVDEPAAVPRQVHPGSADAHQRSDLAAQLEHLERIRSELDRGQLEQALGNTEALQQSFPHTVLKPELEVLRVEALVRLNRDAAAITLLETLVARPAHEGRRSELQVLLGDLLARTGQCAKATRAYQAASVDNRSARSRSTIRASIEACTDALRKN